MPSRLTGRRNVNKTWPAEDWVLRVNFISDKDAVWTLCVPVNTELWLLIELVRLYCIILNETQYDPISSWSLTQINWGWNCTDIFPSSYPPLPHPIAEWWPMYTWMRRPSPWPNSLNNVMSMPSYPASLLIFHVLLGMFWASSPVFYCEMNIPEEVLESVFSLGTVHNNPCSSEVTHGCSWFRLAFCFFRNITSLTLSRLFFYVSLWSQLSWDSPIFHTRVLKEKSIKTFHSPESVLCITNVKIAICTLISGVKKNNAHTTKIR